ncbi:MAG: branched-chain amino acid aminotransferase [Candidatus Thermoplasmatota archaeon]|nr:branched-chain amino acid aminotransferase [Candidatus Thermoplasmatota archaeon]
MKSNGIDLDNLTFSFTRTRSMYVAKCELGGEWKTGNLVPFEDLHISPAAGVLNYGQGLFEGMKAYKWDNGKIVMFRPEKNAERATNGCSRLSMPQVPVNMFLDATKKVVIDNADYVPSTEQGALYVRPIIFGSGAGIGVAPSTEYTFVVYVSPVGPYFKGGLSPIRLIVTNDYHRAPLKGTGGVKAIGNYVPGMLPSGLAKKQGYAEVIYLDAAEEKYIEEVGAANFFAIIDGRVITPELTGSILPGVTRESVLHLARERMGLEIEERRISVDEALTADEVFCAGTAAIIAPIGSINYQGKEHVFSEGMVGKTTKELYDALTGIQFGTEKDEFGWMAEI